MYLRSTTRLKLPLADCEAVLLAAVGGAAGEHPRVGFKIGPAPVRKRVRLDVGTPERPGQPLFPVLDGYLQLEQLGPQESKLSLKAGYQPPLGRLGQAIDGAALHAVAKATVNDFVSSVRDR